MNIVWMMRQDKPTDPRSWKKAHVIDLVDDGRRIVTICGQHQAFPWVVAPDNMTRCVKCQAAIDGAARRDAASARMREHAKALLDGPQAQGVD